jgi:hypothetical protein
MIELVFAAALGANVDAEVIPKVQAEIAAACGASPALGVLWGDFGEDESAAGAVAASGLQFVSAAFATVCKDAALKAEVGKQVAKVLLRQAHGAADPVIYISKQTLYIEYLWVAKEPAPDAAFVAKEIADRLRGGEPEAP